MSDDLSPGLFGRILPSKSRVIEFFAERVFSSRNEKLQKEAGIASATQAVRVEDDDQLAESPATASTEAATPAAPAASDLGLRFGATLESEDDPAIDPGDFEHAGHVGHEPDAADLAASRAAAQATSTPDEPIHDPTVAAFFDVDNTLVQGASIILLARGLAKHKFFSSRDLTRMLWQQTKFRISGNESMSDVASGREKALSFVKGREVREVEELSEEVFDRSMTDRFWPGTKALAQMHIDAGQQVWLVTATPVELARVIASRLGVTGALGTVAESENGVYTGRLVGDILHGSGKAHAVKALAEREGFDLSKCYAYSDSYNDLPMLSLVGNPVAINPDSRLKDAARARGWQIKDFRTVRRVAKVGAQSTLAAAGIAAVGASTKALLDRRK